MMLDATAGNRLMWQRKEGERRIPPNVVFMDKEINLGWPPDIIADFTHCPFRGNIFTCVFFDPPYSWHIAPWHEHPSGYQLGVGRKGWHKGTFYGRFENRRDLIVSIYKAQKEFQRITKRLCFKWNEYSISLWNILSLFKKWTIQNTKVFKANKKRSNYKTYWITLILSEPQEIVSTPIMPLEANITAFATNPSKEDQN